ncbi:MAG TPA: ABC transporter substrate-binding protein [Thermomicrobiaceae bacterium]|nr:ABC transporter substrate-binding protein [Thermomicrobiaceae bacterium]
MAEHASRLVDRLTAGRLSRRTLLRSGALAGAGASALGLLAACGGSSSSTTPGSSSGGATQASGGSSSTAAPTQASGSPASGTQAAGGGKPKFDKVVIAESADIRFFDPTLRPTSTDATILVNIYDNLTQLNDKFELVPGLSTKWELGANDQQTWTFTLRQGVKFHNDEPFNADTITAWYDRLVNIPTLVKDQPSSIQQIASVDKVSKVDDFTVSFHTKYTDPVLPRNLATYFLQVPSKTVFEQGGPNALAEKGVGTGPYKFVEWVKASHVSLEANNDYWGGKPAIQKLEFRTIPEPSARSAALLNGEVEIADAIPIASLKQIASSANAEVRTVPLAAWIFWVQLNARDIKELQDVKVRQAMNYAVDKQAIIDSVLAGNAINSASIVTKECFGYKDVPLYEYDPDKAKQLLKEAGYENGFSVKFYYSPGHYVGDTEAVQAIANYLGKVGIKCDFVQNEWANQLSLITNQKIDGIVYGGKTILSIDADYMFAELQPKKNFGWMYPLQGKAEELYNQERQEMDPAKRADLCGQISQLYRDEAGILFLWEPKGLFGVAKGLVWSPPGDGYIRAFTMS